MEKINSVQVLTAAAFAIDNSLNNMVALDYITDPILEVEYSNHRFLNHSMRTCYIAMRIANEIIEEKDMLRRVYLSSALHDIGVLDCNEAFVDGKYSMSQHINNGSKLIKRLQLGDEIAEYIKYHHENYDGSGVLGLKSENIPLVSRIIRLADIFEMLYKDSIPNYVQRKSIKEWIISRKGRIFDSDLVDTLLGILSKEYFWCDIEVINSFPELIDDYKPEFGEVSIEKFKCISEIFSQLVDSRNPFTINHSKNLHRIAVRVCDFLEFDYDKRNKFEIAALLHDVGKLAVPNFIENKSGKIRGCEISIMKAHPYFTGIILSRIEGLEETAIWSANHHERLNGSGYPRGLTMDDLTMEDRILAVCNIYETLTTDGLHKNSFTKSAAFTILDNMVINKEICSKALDIIKEVV